MLISIILAISFFVILYFVVKSAVRNGIIEAHDILRDTNDNKSSEENSDETARKTCRFCNAEYDPILEKCPRCGCIV